VRRDPPAQPSRWKPGLGEHGKAVIFFIVPNTAAHEVPNQIVIACQSCQLFTLYIEPYFVMFGGYDHVTPAVLQNVVQHQKRADVRPSMPWICDSLKLDVLIIVLLENGCYVHVFTPKPNLLLGGIFPSISLLQRRLRKVDPHHIIIRLGDREAGRCLSAALAADEVPAPEIDPQYHQR
jgi:hypothetical protein